MPHYQKLQHLHVPATQTLFTKRITTLEGLLDTLSKPGTAFIALDTEYLGTERGHEDPLHQVGLAYTQTLKAPITHASFARFTPSRPRIAEFHEQSPVQALALNVSTPEERIVGAYVPIRSSCRFGAEQEVGIEGLEARIISFIEGCTRTGGDQNLILVGYQLSSEWPYLVRHFPQVASYFSSWVDIRDIATDVAPVGNVPGLKKLLYLFGYHHLDIAAQDRYADNAGEDAVFTLAAASALLFPEKQRLLRLHQEFRKAERTWVRKGGFLVDGKVEHPFAATVQCEAGKLPLPRMIGKGLNLATWFHDFGPESAGLLNAQTACITFETLDQLERFILATNGTVLPTGHRISTEHMEDAAQRYAETQARRAADRKEKQASRRRWRLSTISAEEGFEGMLALEGEDWEDSAIE